MTSTNVEVRESVLSDLPQITEIYNSIVRASTAVYNDQPATLDQRVAWWSARLERGLPVLVAADAETIHGYGSFGEFRSWPGYRFTVEVTVHIREGVRGQGIGSRLLVELIARARALGMHIMVGCVDSENFASIRFLARHGFIQAGQLREVGYKFGRFLHLNLVQLALSDPENPTLASTGETSTKA